MIVITAAHHKDEARRKCWLFSLYATPGYDDTALRSASTTTHHCLPTTARHAQAPASKQGGPGGGD